MSQTIRVSNIIYREINSDHFSVVSEPAVKKTGNHPQPTKLGKQQQQQQQQHQLGHTYAGEQCKLQTDRQTDLTFKIYRLYQQKRLADM